MLVMAQVHPTSTSHLKVMGFLQCEKGLDFVSIDEEN